MMSEMNIVASLDIVDISYQLVVGRNYLIGRKTENGPKLDIELHSASVDDKHAVIQISDGAAKILDLYSKFGTFLNGQRINGLTEVTISTSASLLFGEVVSKLQFCSTEEKSHDSSGFNDGQKNSSDVIPSSPECFKTKCASRLKAADKNSFTSTPNSEKSLKNKCETSASIFDVSLSQHSFLAPLLPLSKPFSNSKTTTENPNISTSSFNNTSLSYDSSDSFCIPATQQCKKQTSRNLLSTESYPKANRQSQNQSKVEVDDELCIPETQELASSSSIELQTNVQPNQMVEDANFVKENFNDPDITCGSQFRICTQDFNDVNCFGENLDDPDSSIFQSLVIPCIKHKPVAINDSEEALQNADKVNKKEDASKMSDLNWSEHDSLNTTLNCEQSERDLACTPDLFDLPDLALANIQSNFNMSSKNEATCAPVGNETMKNLEINSEKPTSSNASLIQLNARNQTKLQKSIEPSMFEDEEDLMPTQVFFRPEKFETTTKCSPEYLTLSDKENMLLPVSTLAELENELQPTQLLPRSSHKTFEKTPKKSEENDFLKPVGMLTKKSSTLSNVSSMSENSDVDMLMCTPQIIAENFNQPDSKSRTNFIAKQRSLFGEDSDDEDTDVLKLITAPKVPHDFDKLLPHLKKQVSPKREQEDAKLHNYNRSFSSKDEAKSKGKTKIGSSRDERHAARDKKNEKSPEDISRKELKKSANPFNNIEKNVSKKRRNPVFNNSDICPKSPKKIKAETINEPIETSEKNSNSINFSNKVQNKKKNVQSNSGNANFKQLKNVKAESIESSEKTLEEETTKSGKKNIHTRATNSRSHFQPIEKGIPARRMTRSKSRTEDAKIFAEEIESKEIVNLDKKSEQKSERKSKTDKNHGNGEVLNNRKIARTCSKDSNDTKKKRLRSTSSIGDSNNNNSSKASSTSLITHELRSKRLQVSMTMVDPDHFENLVKNSSGIWSVAEDPSESDVLIMDKGNRTFKFLLAMARGITVVTSSWLESINKAHEITSMNKYLFKDESFEKRHKFSLTRSIELARKQKLFEDYNFLMTPKIRPQCDEMKVIIKCAGGRVFEDVQSLRDTKNVFLVSTKDDQKLWHKYRRVNNNIRIINTEGVMSSVMRQTVQPLESNLIG